MGFNLPFDISRLALGWGKARGRFYGGFSFPIWFYEDDDGVLQENRYRPRICVDYLTSKQAFIGFTQPAEAKKYFPDRFLDLRTLTFALTNKGLSLRGACEEFGIESGKGKAELHGLITPDYIKYNRQDVAASANLLEGLLGHGRSEKPRDPARYGPPEIDDAVRLLDHLGIFRAHVVGYSRGARVAHRLRARHPARLRTVTLGGYGEAADGSGRSPVVVPELSDSMEAGRFAPLVRAINPDAPAEEVETLARMLAEVNDGRAVAAALRADPAFPPLDRDELRANEVPTLALIGEHDRFADQVRQMSGSMDRLEVLVTPEANHVSALRAPEYVTALVGFLAKYPLEDIEARRGIERPAPGPSEGSPRKFFWRQCDEDVLQVRADPGPLQRVVGPEFTVLEEDGHALVLIVVQDCSAHWIDGEEVGPTQDVHQWVAIAGPGDVRPVAGAQRTLPTMTWFALFTGSSDPRIRAWLDGAGTPSLPLDGVSLQPYAPRQRGRVSVAEGLGFSWEARSAEPFARLVAVNHDVYARDRAGKIVYNRIQALLNVFSWDSPGTMEVVGGTEPRQLIGAGTHPVLVHSFRPLWAWGTLGDEPPER